MKRLKILLLLLVLFISISAVSAEGNFTTLQNEINTSTNTMNITQNYVYDNTTDNQLNSGVIINKTNFTINGNGFTIDGSNQSRIFKINGQNITINNLILINGNFSNYPAIDARGKLTLNNVTFINNNAKNYGAVGITSKSNVTINNSKFIDNYGNYTSSIYVENSVLNLYNTEVTSKIRSKYGQIIIRYSTGYLDNVTFVNISSEYTPALFFQQSKTLNIKNSKFMNLTANITAGAIAIKSVGNAYIENCEFINTTSSKNAGAVFTDIAGDSGLEGSVTITNTTFTNASSEFGGAYIQLGGRLSLNNSEFTNNHATFNGGAVYLSYTESEINNCTFDSNGVDIFEGYPTYGGAILSDKSILLVNNSKFTNNLADTGNAIYAYDTSYLIANSTFENNTNAIYTVFDNVAILENNIYNGDNVSTNNTYYATIVCGEGMNLVLLNNTIDVKTLPSRFDLRDWGWVSSVKNQGWMGSCWTFGMTGVLESALLKAAGITTDFSENNMQNTMLKYSIYGGPFPEGGLNIISTGYLLSWLGAFTQDADTYDELGKISPTITTDNDIHIQDLMFIPNNEIPNGTQLKEAIIKYGSIDVSYNGQSTYNEKTPYYNPNTYAQYVDEALTPNHAVSIVGWDDNFPKEKFAITPPGDGAWIVKNSWGTGWGENGYLYVSYYDKTLIQSTYITNYATAIITENTERYNKNYQYETFWSGEFLESNGNVSYYNMFEAVDDDLIAAVGTYFNQSGIDYKVEIYVNDELKLTQEGVSPYLGYHTIKLNEYIPVYEGDIFKAIITSNTMPFTRQIDTRVHYTENLSFASIDGEHWDDCYEAGVIACLKVYTVANPIKEKTFSVLENEIASATENYLILSHDYEFFNRTDNSTGIVIDRDNFVIDGNGYTLDAKNQSRIFNITGNNVTIMNLVLINGNSEKGSAIYSEGTITLDNIAFINNTAKDNGGAIRIKGNVTINCNNSAFIDNYASTGSSICVSEKGELNLYNSYITSKISNKYSQIVSLENTTVYLENVSFVNSVSTYSPALYLRGAKAKIINSEFVNLTANISSGAISIKGSEELYIENCAFINTTSSKNAGAILADIAGATDTTGNVTILNTIFKDTSSEFGGAYLQLGGNLFMNNTEFTNNHATYNGGAVYLSHTKSEINNCTFDSNGVDIFEGYPTYGGAILSDMGALLVNNSKFTNNIASAGNAIYTYDTAYVIANSTFENNTNALYTVFDKVAILENNIYNGDNVSTNNTYYATIVTGEGLHITLINNDINVNTLPSRFDLRDWGWVSSVKNQGWMGSCWTFGMTGALESALLKAAGIATDFSENNMQNTMIRYSIYGTTDLSEGGSNYASTGYLLSWLGAFTQDADSYDELGKISPVITTFEDIHVQDIIFIPNNEIPNGTQIKLAIMKYGSLDVSYFGQSTYNEKNPYYNPKTNGQYVNETIGANHEVSVVGWDDNYKKENFLITPPGDGAWIIKNSWGTDWGDNGYLYVSYYDETFLKYTPNAIIDYSTGIIFKNTVPYNKNYQYDIIWDAVFIPGNKTIEYMNRYEALDDDLIAAVGTYFNQSGVNYTVEIYVNGKLKLTQEGVSPYLGYHTIKLNEYIPIKEGDIFEAKIKSNNMPFIKTNDTRVHYTENLSFASIDGEHWDDCYEAGMIACLKVYTVASDIQTSDLVKIYKNDSQFEANVGAANQTVIFEINGRNYTRLSNENGTAKININLRPGNYSIRTYYNGTIVKNDIEVLPTLIGSNLVKYYRNESQFYVTLVDGEGNPVSNANVTMNINGVFYTRKTNENGTAKLNINLDPGEYILTAIDPLTGLQMAYNVTVLSRLIASDLNMTYLDGSKFNVTVVDNQGNPLANVSVRFNINGVFYTRQTDANGTARLNIRLMPGEYIITSEYENCRIANIITIKD